MMIASTDFKKLIPTSPESVKQKVFEYYELFEREKSELEQAKRAMASGFSASVDLADEEGSDLDRPSRLYRQLLGYGSFVFSRENLEKTYKEASKKDGQGFIYEMELGLGALQQVNGAKIQFGTMSTKAIEAWLGGPIASFKKEKQGAVGGDLTVWFPTGNSEDAAWGGDFIQAKSIKFSSLKDEITKARNQLEGNNAKGKTGSSSKVDQREISLRGEKHPGTIFIEIYDGIQDQRKAESLAKGVLGSPYVHSVVLDDLLSGTKYFYP